METHPVSEWGRGRGGWRWKLKERRWLSQPKIQSQRTAKQEGIPGAAGEQRRLCGTQGSGRTYVGGGVVEVSSQLRGTSGRAAYLPYGNRWQSANIWRTRPLWRGNQVGPTAMRLSTKGSAGGSRPQGYPPTRGFGFCSCRKRCAPFRHTRCYPCLFVVQLFKTSGRCDETWSYICGEFSGGSS